MAATGVFLVVACAALGALVADKSAQRMPYLAIDVPVPQNGTITASDLTVVDLTPAGGLALIPASDEATVVGKQAAEPLLAGTLLTPGALASGPTLQQRQALIGASLAANQLPADLSPGDLVLVVLTSTSGAGGAGTTAGPSGTGAGGVTSSGPTTPGASRGSGPSAPTSAELDEPPGTVLAEANVVSVSAPGTNQTSVASTGDVIVSLAVPHAVASVITAASAANEISLAVLPTPAGSAGSSKDRGGASGSTSAR